MHEYSRIHHAKTRLNVALVSFFRVSDGASGGFVEKRLRCVHSRHSIKVGVDVWDFRPVSLSEIKERARELPANPLWNVLEQGPNMM